MKYALRPTKPLASLMCAFVLMIGCAIPVPISRQVIKHFPRYSQRSETVVSANYLLYEPAGYNDSLDVERRWPAILFLHGLFESGEDIDIITRRGLPRQLELGLKIPFIVVSPQNPSGSWDLAALTALLDEVLERYPIDPDRLYVTGVSLGGRATWDLAAAYPNRIAAIAPISAWGDVDTAHRVKDIPVWAQHGEWDPLVWPSRHKRMIEAVRAAGGRPKWTVIQDAGHDIWDKVYSDRKLYEWFLQHRLKP